MTKNRASLLSLYMSRTGRTTHTPPAPAPANPYPFQIARTREIKTYEAV